MAEHCPAQLAPSPQVALKQKRIIQFFADIFICCYQLNGVVQVAAVNLNRLVAECEGVFKEVNRTETCIF